MRSSSGREPRRRMMSVVRGVFQRWRSPRGIASTQGSTSPRPQVRWLLVLSVKLVRRVAVVPFLQTALSSHILFTSGRADLMAMRTTIWRPNVRVTLDEYGEVEDTESEGEELTKKGTKRKRAPPTKGPCEHGVKYRSKCKVCSACPHGKWRWLCKECGGSQICVHGRERSLCKECGGGGICVHGRVRSNCKECGGASICEHGRQRSTCKECGGGSICEHGRRRSQCKECRAVKTEI